MSQFVISPFCLHFLTSSVAAGFIVAFDSAAASLASDLVPFGSSNGLPFFSVVSAFCRYFWAESISLSSLYCLCVPNLKGGAISEPSIVAAVAFD